MRIAIINVTGGGMSGGYEKYLRNIIPRMTIHSKIEAILCSCTESLDIKEWFGSLPNVQFVSCKSYHFLYSHFDKGLEQQLENFSPDVIFIPSERYYKFNKIPVVNMIQNMEPFVAIDGNPLSERFRNCLRRIDAKMALKKSDRIIAPSEYVRDFLLHNLKVRGDKIGLIYHGVDLTENKDVHRPDIIPKGWDGRFLFTAGSIRPARGLEDVLYALNHLSDKQFNVPVLVIAGEITSRMMKYRKGLEDWIRVHNLSSKVCWAGSLTGKEMAWCYQNCRVFVMTSRVESFGMIAGEAMSHGCVCISSDNPCLPEISDDAAVYYPPGKPEILAKRVQEISAWPDSKKQEMRQRALRRASQFSWDECVDETIKELQKAINDFENK